jgi:PAS domain-containing protein
MNAQSIPAVIIASISFYVGLYHLLIYFRRKQHREDLTFALLCLATGCYDVFCAGLYNASSVVEGAQWQRLQFIALAFLATSFLWFASDYTGQKPGIITYLFTAYYALAVIVQSVDRSHLTWLVDQPAIKTITLPFGHQITYYEATLGVFTAVQGLMGMVVSTYILWISARFYRRGHRREALPLLLALGFMYAAALNDTLVSQGVYQFSYAIEYSYLAVILLMTYSLSSTVVEAAMAKELLRVSEARWQFALEGSGDGVWDWIAQTNQVYYSRQWKTMLGFEEHEIGNALAEWDTRIHPDDRDYVYEEIRKHLEGEIPVVVR